MRAVARVVRRAAMHVVVRMAVAPAVTRTEARAATCAVARAVMRSEKHVVACRVAGAVAQAAR
eukprot:96887-Pleurochrysis_carterae.AAC.1